MHTTISANMVLTSICTPHKLWWNSLTLSTGCLFHYRRHFLLPRWKKESTALYKNFV